MTRFIKLTNMLLNTNNINKILIKPNKYFIYVADKKFDGFVWLIGGSGMGNFTTCNNTTEIEICETKDPIDYKMVSEWIDKN
jgi:hypothetical protein